MGLNIDLNTVSKILVAIDGCEHRCVQQVSDTIGGKVRSSIVGIHVEQDVSYVNPYSFGVYDLITTDEKNSILHDRPKGTKEWFDKIKTSA